MGIDQIIGWYQKKIGTYDRQLWEKTIEQRIHRGLTDIRLPKNSVHLKSMSNKERDGDEEDLKMKSLKTEFIDIDLVRGSSFTKAKPKHGVITVARLASLRFLFFPLYSKWWVQQTSGRIFMLLLSLYILQLFNIAVYTYNVSKLPEDSSEYVPCTEVVVPVIMMWVLSFIHSQIMATQSDHHPPSQTKKRKNFRRRRKSKVSVFSSPFDFTNQKMRKKDLVDNVKKCEVGKTVAFQEHTTDNLPTKFTDDPLIDDGFESFNGNGSTPTVDYNIKKCNSECNVTEIVDSNGNNGSESDISHDENKKNVSIKNMDGKWNEEKLNRQLNHARIERRHFRSAGKLNLNIHSPMKESNRISPDTQGDSTSWESEEDEPVSSPDVGEVHFPLLNESTASATEWMGVTTNTEDCSYSSELTCTSDYEPSDVESHMWDTSCAPTAILSPCCALSDKVSCTVWKKHEIKKVELSVFDISYQIIARVEEMAESLDYFYIGVFYAMIAALLPALFRLSNTAVDSALSSEVQLTVVELSGIVLEKLSGSMIAIIEAALGNALWERTVMLVSLFQRFVLATLFFFLLSVAERTFKQRFLYAKLFSHLTSSRRARKSQLPHFRLNKVRNIKTWLSVRSYLKKRGPQRSVDMIVSSAFIINLLLIFFLSMEILKDSAALRSQYNVEALFWCFGLGCLLLRFMTLGTKINRKYRSNLSILITEQINLYLQIEQKPHKKDELNVANSVLKLAADLLKELETPFKISGFSANPHLYTITKVFVLSALSGVLSEMLGFKLKLHKIKIK